MVRITIVGSSVSSITCPEGSNAYAVKKDLIAAYGKGLLKRGEEMVTSKTLAGDYEFHITDISSKNSTGSDDPVFCIVDHNSNISLGTGFVVTPEFMITANHVRFNYDGSELKKLSAVKKLVKDVKNNESRILVVGEKLELKVVIFNEAEDWCILSCVDSNFRFPHVAQLGTNESDLPEEGALHNQILTIRYYTGGLFRKKLVVKHKAVVFDQYQPCDDVEQDNEAEIQIQGGFTSGVSGAPYFYLHKVVGFHVESDIDAAKFGDDDYNKSLGSTHEQFSIGRVFCRLPKFMIAYTNGFNPVKSNSKHKKPIVNVETVSKIEVANEKSAGSKKRKRAGIEKGMTDSGLKRKKDTSMSDFNLMEDEKDEYKSILHHLSLYHEVQPSAKRPGALFDDKKLLSSSCRCHKWFQEGGFCRSCRIYYY